ncbi:MAG: HlyC/CorC family transporter, partial [Gammaproteobacteria bacterium]|nr:HlyC/CorC family transporter [Gammaproteobacteria bacterium]
MNDIPLTVLFGVLIFLLILSAFFSGSETGLMTLNRYRLRHLVKTKHSGALRAAKLLDRPDRLIGLILLGNNFVNILASSLTTIIALRLGGESAIAIGAGLLTLVILIFAEVAPKTLAALNPERIAFPASYIYTPLLKLLYPLVWSVNGIANGFLRLIRVDPEDDSGEQHLSREELRTVVNEAGALIPKRHQSMLLSILDLEQVTVEDIMVPRNDIFGIDLDDDIDEIHDLIAHAQHTRLPVYKSDIDNILGFVHLRNIVHALTGEQALTKEHIMEQLRESYFIPEATPLNTQLLNFQRQERRIGLVVDEYGDIRGLVTLEDILEEIVGEFTTDPSTTISDIHPQEDGTYLVDGSANIRDLNRVMFWELPTDGPKTLNGLILEYL